ncbi:CBO0543 family protein [Cytobacillus sp. FJAT-54145]|uniref:CBO0543 family protein n=1 Tax=Cytobacillus spartinae TaxID=3299023 RepID=A0ABW6KEJ5_9BACI
MGSYKEIESLQAQLKDLDVQFWQNHMVFTAEWWMLLAAAIVPWIWWYSFVDRKRIKDILFFGFIWMILALVLDELGSAWLLWGYPKKLFPVIPPLAPADLSVIPITFMVIYQKNNSYKMYFKWCLLMSFVFSFIIEVVFHILDLFRLYNWHHWMSFIGFIIISNLTWWVNKKVSNVQKQAFRG